jgi:hypothetical protein
MRCSIWAPCLPFLFLDLLRPLSLQVTEQKLAEVFSTCGQVHSKIPTVNSAGDDI